MLNTFVMKSQVTQGSFIGDNISSINFLFWISLIRYKLLIYDIRFPHLKPIWLIFEQFYGTSIAFPPKPKMK